MVIAKRLILGFLMLFFICSLTKNFFEYWRNLSFYEAYKKEYLKKKEKNNMLKAELIKTNDLYYIEKTIRDKMNLLKQNEIALMLPQQTPTPTHLTPTPKPNYIQWYDTVLQKEKKK